VESEEAEGKMVRVFVTLDHGDHAHYEIKLDTPTEHDEIVKTDKGIDILLDKREPFLDGVWIKYFCSKLVLKSRILPKVINIINE
jgi:Fe-S cluster assembly iron-binding protein IscA